MDIAIFRLRSMLVPDFRKAHARLHYLYAHSPEMSRRLRIVYELSSNNSRLPTYTLMVHTIYPSNLRYPIYPVHSRYTFPRADSEDPLWLALSELYRQEPYSKVLLYPSRSDFPGIDPWESMMRNKYQIQGIILEK